MSRVAVIARHNVAGERTILDFERQDNDWYVEPPWVVDQLLRATKFEGRIHDPCCGGGNIPKRFRELGIWASGADIVFRGGSGTVRDFLMDDARHPNLVFNPPYKIAEQFILRAIELADRKVAAIVNLKFLASQGRRDRLFLKHLPAQVLICSQRPSMPPGGSGIQAKGGTADYCWIVWDNERGGNALMSWLF